MGLRTAAAGTAASQSFLPRPPFPSISATGPSVAHAHPNAQSFHERCSYVKVPRCAQNKISLLGRRNQGCGERGAGEQIASLILKLGIELVHAFECCGTFFKADMVRKRCNVKVVSSGIVIMVEGNAMAGVYGSSRDTDKDGCGYFRLQQRGMRQ